MSDVDAVIHAEAQRNDDEDRRNRIDPHADEEEKADLCRRAASRWSAWKPLASSRSSRLAWDARRVRDGTCRHADHGGQAGQRSGSQGGLKRTSSTMAAATQTKVNTLAIGFCGRTCMLRSEKGNALTLTLTMWPPNAAAAAPPTPPGWITATRTMATHREQDEDDDSDHEKAEPCASR